MKINAHRIPTSGGLITYKSFNLSPHENAGFYFSSTILLRYSLGVHEKKRLNTLEKLLGLSNPHNMEISAIPR